MKASNAKFAAALKKCRDAIDAYQKAPNDSKEESDALDAYRSAVEELDKPTYRSPK